MNAVSVIVPTLNEADNIAMLVKRIAAGFEKTKTDYEILFVDDNSIDGTQGIINSFAAAYPIRLLTKQGPRGKAFSLLEGFDAAKYDILCMIDADLQYPPEAIVPMHRLMIETDTDIVLTNRQQHGTGAIRKITSAGFNFVFTKLMFGFDYDSQSGLKLFKKEVIKNITLDPTPWSFDLEFIVRSLEQNYKIVSYDIVFAERFAGEAKIQVSKVAYELAKASVKLRFNSSPGKIKMAYQTNQTHTKKAIMASAVAVSLLTATLLASPLSGSALENAGANIAGAITRSADREKASANHPDEDEDDEDDRETPAAAPKNKNTGTAPTSPEVLSATDTTKQPVVAAPAQQAPVAPVTQNSPAAAPRSTATSRPPLAVSNAQPTPQFDQPPVAVAATEPPVDNSDLATFPDGTQKTGDFSYTKDKQFAAAGIITPLLITAAALAVLSIGAYIVLSKTGRLAENRNSLEAIKG